MVRDLPPSVVKDLAQGYRDRGWGGWALHCLLGIVEELEVLHH